MRESAALAEFLSGLRYSDIPESVRQTARLALLDTVGVAVAGHQFLRRESDHRLDRYINGATGKPAARVLGDKDKTRAPLFTALFANGTLAEVLDWQDSTLTARIHSGPGAIPAGLAVGEMQRSSGRDLLTAIVAGYEAGARIGVAMQPSHWYRGFQGTGTVGSIGAAVVAGKLMNFGPSQMADVLGTAGFIAPISNGDGVFHGYSIKPIHGGMAAQAGVQSALLVEAGYEAGPLEGLPPRHHGFMNVTSSKPRPSHLSAHLGNRWYMSKCSFKRYPVGLLNIGPVQLVQELLSHHEVDAEQVDRIEVRAYKDMVHFTGGHYTDTRSSLADCQLSTPYTIAVTILDGDCGVEQFSRKRIADPSVHALAAKVTVTEDSSMNVGYPDHVWPQAITIVLANGHRISGRLDAPIGSPNNPATQADLVPKFLACVSALSTPEDAQSFCDSALVLEDVEQVESLLAVV